MDTLKSVSSSTIAYLRASTDKQDVANQKLELLDYARLNNLAIDEFIEITISTRRTTKQRRIDELLLKLQPNDTLIATELSRIGRSTSEVIDTVNTLLKNNVRVIITKQGLDMSEQSMSSKIMVTMFSLFAELERDIISSRTKEALKSKKTMGVSLSKPKGTVQASKYDKDLEKITELLKLGLSVKRISKHLGYGTYISLNNYVKKRKLKEG
jgi:DNA invertase Pin-like site-specific DNA recombinase